MTRDWTQINLRMSKEMHAEVVRRALEDGVTVNGWIRNAVAAGLGTTLDSFAAEIVVPADRPTKSQLDASRRRLGLADTDE